MASTPEGRIQSKIIKRLKGEKVFHFRYNAVSSSFGLPDIICICEGVFVGLEVKTPEGKPTELQKLMQKAIQSAGGIYEFVTSEEEAMEVIQSCRLNQKKG